MNFIFPKLIFTIEKWKWNKEYQLYVSNLGHFKDEHKNIIPIKIDRGGYVVIRTKNGLTKAHRVVMKTFCPTVDMDNLTVDHLDHNKRNNSVINLEWVTKEENKRRAVEDFISTIGEEPVSTNKNYIFSLIKDDQLFILNFKTYEELAEWLIIKEKMGHNNLKITNIVKKIKKAINNNINYCGYNIKIIN